MKYLNPRGICSGCLDMKLNWFKRISNSDRTGICVFQCRIEPIDVELYGSMFHCNSTLQTEVESFSLHPR